MLNLSIERNLAVLLNRLEHTKDTYATLSREREATSRSNAISQLDGMGWRFQYGNVPKWGKASEMDLAIISDSSSYCLVLELKSFIGPAEAREIKERSEEIAKGIAQIKARKAKYSDDPESLRNFINIDSNYEIDWIVASETSIGASYVQDALVPVINFGHLISHLKRSQDLRASGRWLISREFLPVEGKDFKRVETQSQIGNWTVEWYSLTDLNESWFGS